MAFYLILFYYVCQTNHKLTTKKIFVFVAASLVAATTVVTFLSTKSPESRVDKLMVSDVEALAGIEEWWDSLVHDCEEEDCVITVGLAPFVVEYEGKYDNCVDGDSYAHCWDCSSDCDAWIF